LEYDALAHHKRQYIKTFTDNADLLGNGDAVGLIERQMIKAANWDVEDLPQKDTYGVWNVTITGALKKWILDEYDIELNEVDSEGKEDTEKNERAARAVLATALDDGTIDSKKVKELTGGTPIKGRVRYDQWWITGSRMGMISFVYHSIRHDYPDVTSDDIGKWPYSKLVQAARLVENITVASMGNG
jgi:hypothetical protein